MKLLNKSLMIALASAFALTSCGDRDILNDVVDAGQAVPTAYWEVGSTTAKAGETFTFQGKYNVEPGKQVAYSEVWYRVKRDESAAATVKLGGASFAYTKTYSATDTLRSYQPIARFDHSLAEWDGYEFVVKGEVGVSRTLSPVAWADAENWDQERFDSYYPKGFASEFCDEVIKYLTADSTYYSALRTVYINYPFTNEQIKEVNAKCNVSLPDNIDMTKDDQGVAEKSDLWYFTSVASENAITGYYYTQVDAAGNTVVYEIAKDAPTFGEDGKATYNGASCYPVYDAAPWVFCRYDDDLGAVISTVRADYLKAFAELLKVVKFQEWIYDSSDQAYKIDFSRKYSLDAQFRVYDTDGQEGIANDVRVISIN